MASVRAESPQSEIPNGGIHLFMSKLFMNEKLGKCSLYSGHNFEVAQQNIWCNWGRHVSRCNHLGKQGQSRKSHHWEVWVSHHSIVADVYQLQYYLFCQNDAILYLYDLSEDPITKAAKKGCQCRCWVIWDVGIVTVNVILAGPSDVQITRCPAVHANMLEVKDSTVLIIFCGDFMWITREVPPT